MPKPAVAIFVKTPGLSPVKTRLASERGADWAEEFHRRASATVAAVVHGTEDVLTPYWAVAEDAALEHPAWRQFPTTWQGDGGLGIRMHRIYARLQQDHGRALLIGADTPQITSGLLRHALDALEQPETPFVIGPARDGGFWLFGGRLPLPSSIWTSVRYSWPNTALQLMRKIAPLGGMARLATQVDADTIEDLAFVQAALAILPEPVPAQRELCTWLKTVNLTTVPSEDAEQ